MFQRIGVLAVCGVLSACVVTNGPFNSDGQLQLQKGHGAVGFTLDFAHQGATSPMSVEIQRYDPLTGRIVPVEEGGATARAAFSYQPELGRPDRYWTFGLPAGEYAITRIGETEAVGALVPQGGDPLAALLIIGVSLAVTTAIAEAIPDNEVNFVEDGQLLADAPKFTVSRGELVYLGTIRLDAEERMTTVVRTESDGVANEMTSFDASRTVETQVPEYRVLIDYQQDQASLAEYLANVNTGSAAVGSMTLDSFAPQIYVMKEWDDVTNGPRSIARAAYDGPALNGPRPRFSYQKGVTPAPPPAPAPGAHLSKTDRRTLQEQFLGGQITEAEYRAATAKPE
ncbi:hypothetical protein NUH88_12460 [Nisaea acidiphila]|uniref:Uncharacterized protein n=1 Tax=Nisaea acidiphila TaxID=1862145 RepID=A0A9J7AKP8_9PROT|nr:hypothetical protein [Nisaea acidiphila]UUX48227.1 hypothetical protein NUH88_12460 [Nisaea acidiphila]